MTLLNDHALFLRRFAPVENDVRIVAFLRTHGKITLILKGTTSKRSKLKPLAEPFIESDIQFFLPPQSLHGRLTGGRPLHSHPNLRQNVFSFSAACRMAEVVNAVLPARMPSIELYDNLRSSWRLLNSGVNAAHAWIFFTGHILRLLGHGDFRNDFKRFLPPADVDGLNRLFFEQEHGVHETPSPLSTEATARCVAFLESHLETILPARLKSDVMPFL